MTQTVIGVFDTPDTAYQVEETLMDQEGLDESCFHITAQEGQERGQDGIRSFLTELFGSNNPELVEHYAQRISSGGALLSVDLPDDVGIDAIRDTMLNAGATDLDASGVQADTQATAPEESEEQSQAIPVVEEEMEVGKRKVGTGGVRVTSRIEETPVEEDVNLEEERATVSRRPVNRPANQEDINAAGEQSFEVEETAERPVISKSARVVEEVEVGKERSEKTETIEDTVRRTDVDIEKMPAKGKGSSTKK